MNIISQYFTYRLLEYEPDKFIELSTILDKRIKDVPSLKYKTIYSCPQKDGRLLGVISFCQNELELNVIEECLSILAYHPKTVESADEFIRLSSDNTLCLDPINQDCVPTNFRQNIPRVATSRKIYHDNNNNINNNNNSNNSGGCSCGK